MMKKIVIFLGPSLPIAEARDILDAIYLPPAKQADLISAVTTYNPDIIALVDGVFLTFPSVWHKEILYALEQGVAVYGASSMGALRASETDAFGMVGVGEIYRMYASGELIDDDEVALVHGLEETEYRPLSEAMVNVRATFRRAENEGIIDKNLCEQLIAIAKSIYFPERTFPSIFRKAATTGIVAEKIEEIAQFVKEKYVDLKRQDTILLLQTLRDLPEELPQEKPDFTLVRNQFFETLYHRDRTVFRNNTTVPLGNIAGYAALHLPDFEDINFQASNRALVQILAEILGVQVSQKEVNEESQRFRLKHNLSEEAAFTDWLVQNNLSLEEYDGLMYEMARCRHLQKWLFTRKANETNTKILLDELRLQNRYQACADAASEQESIVRDDYPHFPEDYYNDLTLSQLAIAHQRATGCRAGVSEDWMKEAGFLGSEFLKLELLQAHLARKAKENPQQSEHSTD